MKTFRLDGCMYVYGMYLFTSKRLFYEYFRLLNLLNKKYTTCISNYLVLQDTFSWVKKRIRTN
jgi:hypothetical protein